MLMMRIGPTMRGGTGGREMIPAAFALCPKSLQLFGILR
jgi:hypothetical protein